MHENLSILRVFGWAGAHWVCRTVAPKSKLRHYVGNRFIVAALQHARKYKP